MSARYTKRGVTAMLLAAVLAAVSGGCGIGHKRVSITHAPLDSIAEKREGTILVKRFVDARSDKRIPYIGGNKTALREGAELDVLLTGYFAEALREAGYQAVIDGGAGASEPSEIDAVVSGRISEFWLGFDMVVWHNVKVNITLSDASVENVLWEELFHGEQTNMLWWGTRREYEQVISQALTKALNEAAAAFASEEFYSKIPRQP